MSPTILVRDIDLPPRVTPGNNNPRQNSASQPQRQQQTSVPAQSNELPMDFDDDIPF